MVQLHQGVCSTTRNKDPLECLPKSKRTGLRAVCAVMDGGDRTSWKGKSWAAMGYRLAEKRCLGHLYPRWCQAPLASRNSQIFPLGLHHRWDRALPGCALPSVSLCLMGGHFPREAGIGPAHHVMPGIDVGSRPAARAAVLGEEPMPGPVSCGWWRGMQMEAGSHGAKCGPLCRQELKVDGRGKQALDLLPARTVR